MDGSTPFDLIGGADRIRSIVERFYDLMHEREPALAQLHACTPDGKVDRGSRDRFALFLISLLAAAYFLPRLFHYHCLDCGRTGRLTRWKRHVCPEVARRIVEGRPRRLRGPGPLAQTLLWGYVLAVILVLASASGITSR